MTTEASTHTAEVSRPPQVQLLFLGARCLGLPSDQIDALADWRKPTPLPGAPASVLGVVCIRGRMVTVLDLAILLGEHAATYGCLVALCGEEQLALAVDRAGEIVQPTQLEPGKSVDFGGLVSAAFRHGDDLVDVINSEALFANAMRGRERRRRRF